MAKYKNTYRIESTRIKGFDYESSGYYFVTICTKNRIEHFGKIAGNFVILNEIGKTAENIWKNIPVQFEIVEVDAYIIMPDHFHGIVIIDSSKNIKDCKEDIGGFSASLILNYQIIRYLR